MTPVLGTVRRPGVTLVLGIAVGLYVLLGAAEPLLHHSDACHATTPWHCTACSLQITSSGVEDDALVEAIVLLPDAGKLLPDTLPRNLAPLVTRTNGRSPPA